MAVVNSTKQTKFLFATHDEIDSRKKTALAKVDRQKNVLFGELREIRTCTPYLKDSVSEFSFPDNFSLRSTSTSTSRRMKNLYGNRERNYRQLKSNLTSKMSSCPSTKEVATSSGAGKTQKDAAIKNRDATDSKTKPAATVSAKSDIGKHPQHQLTNMADEISFLSSGTRRRLRMARNISMSLEALYNQKRQLIEQEYAYGADTNPVCEDDDDDVTSLTRRNRAGRQTGMRSGFKT